MSKHKFMIYFLTTTLVLPTFTTSIAHAEDTNEDDKMKSSSTQEEQTNHNEDVNDNNINEASQPDDTSPITHLLKHLLRKIRRTR